MLRRRTVGVATDLNSRLLLPKIALYTVAATGPKTVPKARWRAPLGIRHSPESDVIAELKWALAPQKQVARKSRA